MPNRPPPPRSRKPAGRDEAGTEPSVPLDSIQPTEDEPTLATLEGDSELAQKLGNRSPEELYGNDDGTGLHGGAASATFERPRQTLVTNATRAADPDDGGPERNDSPDATRAGPPMKLEITSGPDEGAFKRFRGARLVVGRVKGCDLVLSDQSVSRRHLELVLGAGGVLLRDLGSGNGTKVNGERVTERVVVHGDVIALGQTRLRFVDEAEAFRQAREEAARKEQELKAAREKERLAAEVAAAAAHAPSQLDSSIQASAPHVSGESPSQAEGTPGVLHRLHELQVRLGAKPLKVRAAAGGVLGLALLSLLFWVFHRPPASDDARHRVATQQLELARTALAQGRFKDAADITAFLQKSDPSFDLHGFNLQLQVESKARVSLDLAEGLTAQKRFDDARAELARTPEASAALNARHQQLLQAVDAAQTEYLVRSAEDALSRHDFAAAGPLVAALPRDLQPDFTVRLAKEKERAAKEQVEDAKRQASASQQRKKREAAARRAFVDEAFAQVSRRMGEGDFTRAALECDRVADRFDKDEEIRVKANAVKRLMPLLAQDVSDAKMKLEAHAYEPATRALRHGRDILARDMELSSPVGSKLDSMMALALVGTAREAFARDDWASAVKQYREALRLSPGNEGAREGLEKLAQQAEELLQDALSGREADSRSVNTKLRLVLELTPRGSSTYLKARRAIAGQGR